MTDHEGAFLPPLLPGRGTAPAIGPFWRAVLDAEPHPAATDQELVEEFHVTRGFHVGLIVGEAPPDHIRAERATIIAEEVAELVRAIISGLPEREAVWARCVEVFQQRSCPAAEAASPVEVAHEMADAEYVITGGAVNYKIPLREVFRIVHQANMTKALRGDEHGKAVRGEGYVSPDPEILRALSVAARDDDY